MTTDTDKVPFRSSIQQARVSSRQLLNHFRTTTVAAANSNLESPKSQLKPPQLSTMGIKKVTCMRAKSMEASLLRIVAGAAFPRSLGHDVFLHIS